MERTRLIAAAPVRSASEAWSVLSKLVIDTLERSSSVLPGSVAKELVLLKGVGTALIAGGHLESKGLVLVDEGLHLTIRVLTADAALEVEENLNPVPGGGSCTDEWTLYVPSSNPLSGAIEAAIKNSKHLKTDLPPTVASEKSIGPRKSLIDVDALRSLGDKS